MVEVTTQATILLSPDQRSIIHDYGDNIDGKIKVYRLEEIRALLQFAKKLHERGWGRSRDQYDIWSILTSYAAELDHSILHDLTSKKCASKDIKFTSFLDVFSEPLLSNTNKEWDIWIGIVNATQRQKEQIFEELKSTLQKNQRIPIVRSLLQ